MLVSGPPPEPKGKKTPGSWSQDGPSCAWSQKSPNPERDNQSPANPRGGGPRGEGSVELSGLGLRVVGGTGLQGAAVRLTGWSGEPESRRKKGGRGHRERLCRASTTSYWGWATMASFSFSPVSPELCLPYSIKRILISFSGVGGWHLVPEV